MEQENNELVKNSTNRTFEETIVLKFTFVRVLVNVDWMLQFSRKYFTLIILLFMQINFPVGLRPPSVIERLFLTSKSTENQIV